MKKLKRNGESNSKRTIWDWLPIKDWSEEKVLSYLSERNIPLHPAYKYLRRFSCRICIYMTDHDLRQVQKNDPEAVEIISAIEDKIGFSIMQRGSLKEILN